MQALTYRMLEEDSFRNICCMRLLAMKTTIETLAGITRSQTRTFQFSWRKLFGSCAVYIALACRAGRLLYAHSRNCSNDKR